VKVQLRNLERGDRELLGGLLSGPPPFFPAFAASALVRSQEQRTALEAGARAWRAQQADLCVLEGLLALEVGRPGEARLAFVEAQRLCAGQAGAVSFAGGPIAGGYLRKLANRQ
jgi:hypothetical protein